MATQFEGGSKPFTGSVGLGIRSQKPETTANHVDSKGKPLPAKPMLVGKLTKADNWDVTAKLGEVLDNLVRTNLFGHFGSFDCYIYNTGLLEGMGNSTLQFSAGKYQMLTGERIKNALIKLGADFVPVPEGTNEHAALKSNPNFKGEQLYWFPGIRTATARVCPKGRHFFDFGTQGTAWASWCKYTDPRCRINIADRDHINVGTAKSTLTFI